MSENRRCCEEVRSPSCSDTREETKKKKKKKKRRRRRRSQRVCASTAEFPKPVSLLPSLPPGGKNSRARVSGSSCSEKKVPKSPPYLLTPDDGAAAEGWESSGSLRWEGVLEDREAEERRLEVYRADRRQRYRVDGTGPVL